MFAFLAARVAATAPAGRTSAADWQNTTECRSLQSVTPGGSFEVLAVNDLGSPSYATPAIGDSRIYIRTVDALWAFGEL